MISEIAAVRTRWTDAVNAGLADEFVRFVTDDAVWLPPRGEAVRGPAALAEWLGELFDRFDYSFTSSHEQVRVVGINWAVEDANFRSVLKPKSGGGEPMVHDGQYTILWRRLESGDWRIDRYIDRTEASSA